MPGILYQGRTHPSQPVVGAVGHEVEQHVLGCEDQLDQHVLGGEDQLEQHVVLGRVQLEQHVVRGEEQLEQNSSIYFLQK